MQIKWKQILSTSIQWFHQHYILLKFQKLTQSVYFEQNWTQMTTRYLILSALVTEYVLASYPKQIPWSLNRMMVSYGQEQALCPIVFMPTSNICLQKSSSKPILFSSSHIHELAPVLPLAYIPGAIYNGQLTSCPASTNASRPLPK